jgi:hypothetical protein
VSNKKEKCRPIVAFPRLTGTGAIQLYHSFHWLDKRQVEQLLRQQFIERPAVVSQPRRLRWRDAHLARSPAEVVIRHVQIYGVFEVVELLAERIGQPAKPLDERADRAIVPLDVRRANRAILYRASHPYVDWHVGVVYTSNRVALTTLARP